MIGSHPSFSKPSNELIPLWRYTNLAKFLSFLQTSNLYFSRSDLLGDPFEGSSTRENVKAVEALVHDDELRQKSFGVVTTRQNMSNLNRNAALAYQSVRAEIFVSCWHASENESAAMWSLYGKDGQAIALQTTFEKLAKELPEDVNMGEVNYIDYNKDLINTGNMYNRFLSKRHSFEHEKEIRAIIWSKDSALFEGKSSDGRIHVLSEGAHVAVDITNLIDRIYIGPTAPTWYGDVVRNIVLQYGYKIQVLESSISSVPVY